MHVTFWGVRGSYPVPGPSTVRYGGQTSCVEVRSASGDCLIVDAGTGLRALGQKLAREKRERFNFVLSHVHWDHIQGLPFFEPLYIPGTHISIHAARSATDELQQVIGGITRHEFFPMPLEAVPALFEYQEVAAGQPMMVGDFQLRPVTLNHPFGAVGYRVECDDTSVAYICDTAPFTEVLHKQHFLSGPEELTDEDRAVLQRMRAGLVETIRDCHTVVYDTHFLPDEYARFPHYGHSTPDHALELCTGIGVKRLVLYHHAPSHNDETMDKMAATYRAKGESVGIEVITAREHQTLPIGELGGEGVPA
jgi:phosphoribosyl 1,2-cyclic phosphodiesterase